VWRSPGARSEKISRGKSAPPIGYNHKDESLIEKARAIIPMVSMTRRGGAEGAMT